MIALSGAGAGPPAAQAPDNMAGLHVKERGHLPTLREFLGPVVEDMDPDNDIEEEYRVPPASTVTRPAHPASLALHRESRQWP